VGLIVAFACIVDVVLCFCTLPTFWWVNSWIPVAFVRFIPLVWVVGTLDTRLHLFNSGPGWCLPFVVHTFGYI